MLLLQLSTFINTVLGKKKLTVRITYCSIIAR